MKQKIVVAILAVISMLAAPASELHAQCVGCYFYTFQCSYNSSGGCGSCYVAFAVYNCGGSYCYSRYGCCNSSLLC